MLPHLQHWQIHLNSPFEEVPTAHDITLVQTRSIQSRTLERRTQEAFDNPTSGLAFNPVSTASPNFQAFFMSNAIFPERLIWAWPQATPLNVR